MIKRNYLNYIGAKDKLLPQIRRELDSTRNTFVDAFCGSCVVAENVQDKFSKFIMNDACWQLIELHKYIINNDIEDTLFIIDKYCKKYGLSKTNKEGYLKAREEFNNLFSGRTHFSPLLFYSLIVHSFNYSIHINSKGGFSVPFGANRSCYNSNLKSKLISFYNTLKDADTTFYNFNFGSLTETILSTLKTEDIMMYCDPPYLSSDSSYSRIYGLKWTEEQERDMYKNLDLLDKKGVHFLLSNVLENNGKVNTILKEWSKKYTVINVDMSYKGCNYQRKDNGETVEVLIKNY